MTDTTKPDVGELKLPVKCDECGFMFRDFAPEGAPACQCGEKTIRAMKDEMMDRTPTNESPSPQADGGNKCDHPWASQDEFGRPYCAGCGVPWKKEFGCPVCNGDCAAANPQPAFCPMKSAPQPPVEGLREALEPFVRMYRGMFVSGHCGGASPEDWPDKWIVHITGGPDGLWTNQHGGVLTVADFRRLSEAATALASPSLSAAPVGEPTREAVAAMLARMLYNDATLDESTAEQRASWLAAADAIRKMYRRFSPVAQESVADVFVKRMNLSDGRADFYVAIKVGDREVTPHVFRDEYKAAYHVALYNWLLNGAGEEPEIVAFGPRDWPAQVTRTVQPATTAGAAADEIARANALRECATIARDHTPGKHDGTLAAHVVGSTIERAILALLSRAGDQK